MTRVGLVILRRSPFARGCIGTCTSTVLNALLERSFADVGRYEKIKKIPKNQKKKSPLITLVVPVTSQTKAEWGGGC